MSVPQWNADIITPEEEGSGTKVLDGNQVVQPTLEGGTNITISDGTISATGGGAEYTAGEGIVISDENAISITETVRSGAALGATSVQPEDLSGYVLASSLATVATSGDYDDLLDKPTIPSVDQNYNSASTNAQSGTAVAGALATVDEVPDVTSTDDGKVLKATYSGGVGSYAWENESGGAQVQADWTEADPSDPSYVQNKPEVLGILAGSGITITESASAITIATELPSYNTTTDVGKVLQVTANGLAWVSLS